MAGMTKKHKCAGSISCCGFVLLLFGAILPGVIEQIMQEGLNEMLIVDSPDAPEYKGWLDNFDPDDPIEYEKVYVFNVTNFEEVLQGARPNVLELGPYVWRKNWKVLTNKPGYHYEPFPWYDCDCPTWLMKGEVAFYQQWNSYDFLEADTAFHPVTGERLNPFTDKVYTPSIPYLAAVPLIGENLTWSLNGRLFHRMNVQDLVWGYTDPLIKTILDLGPGPITLPLSAAFVYFLRNYTSEADARANAPWAGWRTGMSDPDEINDKIMTYGLPYVDFWRERQYVYGTSGFLFRRNLKKGSMVNAWDDNTMRTVPFVNYNSKTVEIKGISLLYYQVLKEGWLPASQFPLNELYYQDSTPVGLINLTQLYAAPVLASRPHFLECDPAVAEGVSGLKGWSGWDTGNMEHEPDYDAHDITLSVEPYSGITMQGALRLQLVVDIRAGVENSPSADWLPFLDIPLPSPLSIAGVFQELVPCPFNLIPETLDVATTDGSVTMTDPNSAVVLRGSVDYKGALDVFGQGPSLPVLCFGQYYDTNNTFSLSCEEFPAGRSCSAVYQSAALAKTPEAAAAAAAAIEKVAEPAPARAYEEAYKNLRSAYYPILWIEEGAEITDDLADEFKDGIIAGLWFQNFILIFGCTVGSVMLVGGASWLWYDRRRSKYNKFVDTSPLNAGAGF
eukprot:TRINITY_DN662_c0_g2_i1.p1 TRINITY_DN662_c0_g2~~TRINITY_DN662_c0_g2_i1.p1  ORF type:complete len:686 (+),score=160.55 TRINITY_DN662_c0_g2_i1:41-2059(+)